VIELSPTVHDITASGLFPAASQGDAGCMEDTQRDARVTTDSSTPGAEESRSQETAAATVARLLANPRRIRRN
jgi:hypothetical protein